LVVIRAAGIYAWQFLFAPLVLGLMIALLKIALINPLSVALISRFEQMEAKYLSVSDSTVNIARTGLWLRQKMSNGQIAIIHAQGVKMPEWSFHPVTAFFFDTQNQLTYRIDAEQATIDKGEWIFTKAWSNKITHDLSPDVKTNRYYNILRLPTPISLQDIQSRFASPRTIPFWSLPDYAHIMEETGFESHMLWAHFYNLLAEPILNVALILLAASLSLRAPRLQRGWWLVGMTIGAGFIVFFLGDFLQALGISERLPLSVAAFAPATISLLMGLTALLYLEDG
jgi:lipopolysaccharide export system permease protein